MPANLATTDDRTAMMYAGETPWHGLGTRLDEPATAEEAIGAAGLDYRVELHSLRTDDAVPIPQRKAVLRSDTRQVLGVVGNSYVPVQNHQCFGFLDGVVADGRLRYHTAGALGKGEKVWMLAKLPNKIRVRGSEDVTEQFLLLSNSHDGSSSLRVFFTPIRVVCGNTLAAAERRGRGQGVSVIHKGDLAAKVGEAQEVLGFARRYYDDLEERINHLAGHYPSRTQLEAYFETLYPDSDEGKNRRAENVRTELFRLFEHGLGQDIDVLLMEGTHFGSDRTGGKTEFDLEEEIVEYARTAPALVLVCFSPIDVDRLVTYYRSARRSGRTFVADAYAAFVMHLVSGEANIPRPRAESGIRVYFNRHFEKRGIKSIADRFEADRITLDEILADPDRYLMVFRPSMRELDFDGTLPERSRCLYSYWKGYLERGDWTELQEHLAEVGGDFVPAHTSGHIYVNDIVEFVREIDPRTVIPIHTFEPDHFGRHFPNVRVLNDGEAHEVTSGATT
jgi:phage/plasmid-like protein (TIGR03299 family)